MSRVAILGGGRTPFCRAGSQLAQYSFLDLGSHVLRGVVEKLSIRSEEIDEFVFGTVLLDPRAPNFAREILFRSGISKGIPAQSVSNNCISGLLAVTNVVDGIRSGRLRAGLAGGAESMSLPTLTLHSRAEAFFLRLARARSLSERLAILSTFRPKFLFPLPPSPREPSTGLTMGEHCELTVKEFGIPRQLQDEIAFRSHQNSARAQSDGILRGEIIPIDGIEKDNLIRSDTSLEKLSKLNPVFDRTGRGTLTAGNSSALTDGASVVYLASEEFARSAGREVLAYIEGIEFSAIDPNDGLLMAPALAVPRLLERLKLSVDDIDVFEIHEAFGGQVAANLAAWRSGWGKFPKVKPIGDIPQEKINPNGGSIALGHPFAATGGRILLSLAHSLKRMNKRRGLISVCAAGAMACAITIVRD